MIFPDEGNCVAETLELIFFQILASVDDLGLTAYGVLLCLLFVAVMLLPVFLFFFCFFFASGV